MLPITLSTVAPEQALALLPLLHDADEDDERVRVALLAPANTVYRAMAGTALVGAAVVCWTTGAAAYASGEHMQPEILLIAVAADQRGQGIGAQMLAALVDEACQQHMTALYVGTGNASLATIGWYQRAGFRMDHVRRDYFAYVQPPISENGIPLRDMLVLRHDLE